MGRKITWGDRLAIGLAALGLAYGAWNGVGIDAESEGLAWGMGIKSSVRVGHLTSELAIDPTPGEWGDFFRGRTAVGDRTLLSLAVERGPIIMAGGAGEEYKGPFIAALTLDLNGCLAAELWGGRVEKWGDCK